MKARLTIQGELTRVRRMLKDTRGMQHRTVWALLSCQQALEWILADNVMSPLRYSLIGEPLAESAARSPSGEKP